MSNTKTILKGLAISFGIVGVVVAINYLSKKARSGATIKNLKNKTPNKILFVGDSITASPLSYPKIIEKNNPDLTIDVLAKGGEPTKWMVKNLPSQLSNKSYDRVYIYGGVNDAWNDSIKPESTFKNLQNMVDMVNANGADAFIIIGYEPSGFMDYTKMPVTRYQNSKEDNIPLIAKYKNYQNAVQSVIKNANFISKIDISGMTPDGIHPSSKGQNIIADVITNSIKNV